jgi:hypothetical protein
MKKVLSFIWKYLKIFFKALGKFLKYFYASNIVCLLLSIIVGLCVSELLGVIFMVISILLWINDTFNRPPAIPAV